MVFVVNGCFLIALNNGIAHRIRNILLLQIIQNKFSAAMRVILLTFDEPAGPEISMINP